MDGASNISSLAVSAYDLNVLKSSSASHNLQTMSFEDIVSAKCSEENGDSQTSLLKLWWGLIQDQLTTLNREIESLRHSNAQMETRQSQFVQFLSEQQNSWVAARQSQEEAVVEHIAKERKTREEYVSMAMLEMKADLQQWVRNEFEQEFNQTKTMLARARQILDSDENLRTELQNLMQTEMVSKNDFFQETQKLWNEVKIDRGRGSSPCRGVPASTTLMSPLQEPQKLWTEVKMDRSRASSPCRGVSASRSLMSPMQANLTLGSMRSPQKVSSERVVSPMRSMQTSPPLVLPSATASMQPPLTMQSPAAFSPGAFAGSLTALSPRPSDLKSRTFAR
mmetsp:Transcript_68307/g.108386  ORF Transcript_68307/g.108386 Transcript_68307/m.108386 type:complete len:337 (+) Transcript_68307:28-1038(+)